MRGSALWNTGTFEPWTLSGDSAHETTTPLPANFDDATVCDEHGDHTLPGERGQSRKGIGIHIDVVLDKRLSLPLQCFTRIAGMGTSRRTV